MSYVGSDGKLVSKKPLSKRVQDFLWGGINFVWLFVYSFIQPGQLRINRDRNPYTSGSGGRRPPQIRQLSSQSSSATGPSFCSSCG